MIIETQKKLSKILVLSTLLIEVIDDPLLQPTKQTKQVQDKARELQDMLAPIVDEFYENNHISKTTFFNILSDKFNYIFNKEYK